MKINQASKALPIYKGKILMILRDDIPSVDHANMWEPPGGGFEKGENKEEAFLREFKEELSIFPTNYKYVGVYDYGNEETGKLWAIHSFVVDLTDNEVSKLKLRDEGQEFRFFDFGELKEYTLTPLAKGLVGVYENAVRQKP